MAGHNTLGLADGIGSVVGTTGVFSGVDTGLTQQQSVCENIPTCIFSPLREYSPSQGSVSYPRISPHLSTIYGPDDSYLDLPPGRGQFVNTEGQRLILSNRSTSSEAQNLTYNLPRYSVGFNLDNNQILSRSDSYIAHQGVSHSTVLYSTQHSYTGLGVSNS